MNFKFIMLSGIMCSFLSVFAQGKGDTSAGEGLDGYSFKLPLMSQQQFVSSDEIIFDGSEGIVTVQIENSLHQLVHLSKVNTFFEPILSIPVTNYPAGVYWVTITNEDGIVVFDRVQVQVGSAL